MVSNAGVFTFAGDIHRFATSNQCKLPTLVCQLPKDKIGQQIRLSDSLLFTKQDKFTKQVYKTSPEPNRLTIQCNQPRQYMAPTVTHRPSLIVSCLCEDIKSVKYKWYVIPQMITFFLVIINMYWLVTYINSMLQ